MLPGMTELGPFYGRIELLCIDSVELGRLSS